MVPPTSRWPALWRWRPVPEATPSEAPLRYAGVTPRCEFCAAVLVGGRPGCSVTAPAARPPTVVATNSLLPGWPLHPQTAGRTAPSMSATAAASVSWEPSDARSATASPVASVRAGTAPTATSPWLSSNLKEVGPRRDRSADRRYGRQRGWCGGLVHHSPGRDRWACRLARGTTEHSRDVHLREAPTTISGRSPDGSPQTVAPNLSVSTSSVVPQADPLAGPMRAVSESAGPHSSHRWVPTKRSPQPSHS